jgi:microcin C transport system substrate-binding protein
MPLSPIRLGAALIAAAFMLLPGAAMAERVEGLSMHGAPKYGAAYPHFDYVNPDAPKGGTLRLAKTGSFDNLNNNVISGTAAEGLEHLNDRLMQRAWNEPFGL